MHHDRNNIPAHPYTERCAGENRLIQQDTIMPCRLGINRGIDMPVVYNAHCQRRAVSATRPIHQPAVLVLRYMHRHDSHHISAARQAAKLRTAILFISPVLLVWLIHILLFIPDYGFTFSARAYNEFITTTPAAITCYALYAVFVVEFIYILKSVNQQIIRFKEHIDNYCSGKSRSQSRWLIAVVISMVTYYIIDIVDMCISTPMMDSIVLWLLSLIIIVNSMTFIMCREIYWNISPAFATDKIPLQRAITAEDPYPEAEIQAQVAKVLRYHERGIPYYAISQIEKDEEESAPKPKSQLNSIDNIVKEWTLRDDKPYLKESITITQVAEEMGLNVRLLSNYINNVKGRNFNSWINYLKVQETKVVLLADRTLPLSDIAYRMGFADLASMSRIFKQMEGMPPSVYRQRN